MALNGELYGAGKLSPHSFCMDCNKPILDVSRTRKKLRCPICNAVRLKKILHFHSTRHRELRKQSDKKKKSGTMIWSKLKSKSIEIIPLHD